jgi:hypothetical protein
MGSAAHGVVLMVESICRQGFAYAREVEKISKETSQTRAKRTYRRDDTWRGD